MVYNRQNLKMKIISKVLLIVGFTSCLSFFSSCEKEETTSTDQNYGYNDDDEDFWKKNATSDVETVYVEKVSFSK